MKLRTLAAPCALALGLASAAYAEDNKIRFDGFPDFDSSLKVILPDFQKQSGIQVDYLMNNHGDHHTKLTTNLAIGSGAGDVIVVDVEKIGPFVASGGLVNLSKQYGADKYQSQFAPYAWAQGKGGDGSMYGIPVDLGPGVMYYRTDIFEKAGIDVKEAIKDWDSYIAAGETLKKQGVQLIASAADVAQAIIFTTVPEGEGLYFDQAGNPVVTSKRFVHAFQVAKKIRDKQLDARILAWSNEWYEGFRNGTFATQLSGAWLLGHLNNWIAPDTKGKWAVSHLPDGIYGSWGGSFLSIPKQSKHQDEAWKLIEYMTVNRDVQLTHFETIAAFPANTTTYNDPLFEQEVAFLGGQKARLLFADVAKNIKPVQPGKDDHVARSIILENALMEVLDEGKDIETALKEAERLIKRRTRNL
ncbi:putative ABC-type sugar transport system,periplasmic component [Vibrio nigripulchritudo SFn27]|uniref:Putative ABC-type sugar transport system, periplasmic component n=1 Tax=Vibrio nigripulchritudo TaxID=28173 RepID=U4K7Z5_9VIBR|nr:extracellular solute-binding protein [Vibrio nigripulchritudo]CCN83006.1 putative ABC-type sugar transport system,periplasmic component [Vibrio nigripulchritudo BLFn1]CCN90726.1 putative ABC-type sugar transport system,periplasmic component [Vibrio nigripulchritudo SFn27]CCN97313.1 putative ABC-type sugar transport system,periplasmic component [Vibrio nigripulchritudo ENn2]CCO39949.1 putative ABC-type sugar transport system,periplasmic component [Vibrio nigripulchritudo SFn135]CCO51089.1 pu